jgi:Zn finger protein HypA/HybF involved in hydrogenase expression
MYLVGDDLTLAMFTWLSGQPKAECEVQLYAMVDQAAAALDAIEFNVQCVGCTDAIEFNVLVAQCKNCKYFVGKIDLSWT